jgi:hypothetical protein
MREASRPRAAGPARHPPTIGKQRVVGLARRLLQHSVLC